MTSGRALLLIADIGGYTEYMSTHRMSLAHVEVNTARMLDRVVDAAAGFELVEIEGDAAFLARPAERMAPDEAVAEVVRAAAAMHRAFHVERRYVATNLCPCNGCAQADRLTLKFVAHVGEVATQTIRQRHKLVGIDVILVHRLLKNPVELPEYVLLSEDLYRTGGTALPDSVDEVAQELEGIGEVMTYVVDVDDLDVPFPSQPEPTWRQRLGRTAVVAGTGLPYMLGLRRRRSAEAQ